MERVYFFWNHISRMNATTYKKFTGKQTNSSSLSSLLDVLPNKQIVMHFPRLHIQHKQKFTAKGNEELKWAVWGKDRRRREKGV